MGKFFCVEKFPQAVKYFQVECRIAMDSTISAYWHTVYTPSATSNHNPIPMKKNLNIFVLAVALLVTQACGTKSKENSGEYEATETPVAKATELTPTERRAKVEKDRAERAEKRRIEFENRVKITPTYTDSEGKVIYNKAEVDPSFTGGEDAMMKYLNDNLNYPKDAEEKGVEGTVFVDFVVAADGTVREAVVTDAPGEEVDQSLRNEAIRVVTAMPKWVPGRQRGKPVDVKFSLPVTFLMR